MQAGHRRPLILAAMSDGPQVVILAAGEGTRMRSARPKALHPIAGRALIDHVIDTAARVSGRPPVVVVSPSQSEVAEAIAGRATCVTQTQARGTGDALGAVPAGLRGTGTVVVLYADVPLLKEATLRELVSEQSARNSPCVLLAATPANPDGLGRLSRDASGRVTRIIEASELTDTHGDLHEVNVGAYAFNGPDLWPALDRLGSDNRQGEIFLTDLIEVLGGADTVTLRDLDEGVGINDRVQLARAEAILRRRVLEDLMLSGVTVEDPATTYVGAGVKVGRDSVIRPMTLIAGATTLGAGCEIGPMAQLRDVIAGDRVKVGASVIESSSLGDDVEIGHFDRVRPDSHLGERVSLGTHAEVKNSTIGAGTRINHFACVLDSEVGEGVNVGAGTVTCNYNGHDKARTVIGNRVFVGTNSTLIAPVELADDSYVAAGSVINQDVPENALGVGRARQRNVEGWTKRGR
jgi:bifunctional UDP-N-acetylglucosamine pyrophosphorylase / glucosamine-1-phosphate N-acetyltransferase